MGDILNTSISGLLAFQQALSVTSNNVSNAATPGYSRQNINLAEALGTGTGTGYIGNGVNVKSIARSYDETLAQQVRTSTSSYQSFNTLATQATSIDNMLSSTTTGLTVSLQNFINSMQSLSTAPNSTAQRQVMISQAQALTQQLKNYQTQINQQSSDLEQQIGTGVTQINSLAKNIASLNAQIAAAEGGSGQTPNQLLDQRDQLVDQLSQYVNITTVPAQNDVMNIYMGTGQALVVNSTSQTLVATPDQNDGSRLNIGISNGAGASIDITPEITGGSLGGLLVTRSQVLDPTQNALGQIAIGIANVVNTQQAGGMDLSGNQGQPMFSVGSPQSLPSANNTGGATVNVTLGDLSQLSTDNYKMTYDGSNWQLLDTTSGQAVPMTGSGTAADPFVAAGMSIVVDETNGAPATGDNFAIRPTAGAISGMSVLFTNPSQIAAASLAQASAGAANTGKATISTPTVTDPTNWTPGQFTITFTDASDYEVTDSGGNVVASGAYTSDSPISFNGEQLSISGAAAAGDTFTVGQASPSNTGDNTNILAMAAGIGSKLLNSGTTSLNDAANNLVSATGVLTQQAKANADAQQSVNQAATDARSNLSGVNLDEEAAKMLQYQQAYQACAQMIQTSNTVFQTLISAIQAG